MGELATRVMLDEDLVAKIKLAAKQAGTSDGAVIEEAVRRFVAGNVLERLLDRDHPDEEEALAIHTSEPGALSWTRHYAR
jgi:hypothetical protein